MAITPTPAHYEGFVYGAVDSHTYGVVISDTNAYDSAGRAVEMITIPGRNGAYAMDHKRYENIEITYHCSIPATDPADFISAISDLRNALGALTGYNRLTDDFNDNEYRMAVLKGGVGVTNINPQAGTFDVVFDCKPQRFLTAGETPVTVQDGDTITNPTLYDSKPLLIAKGLGSISIGNETITITNAVVGNVILAGPVSQTINSDGNIEYIVSELTSTDSLNAGDTITVPSVKMIYTHTMSKTITAASITAHTNCTVTASRAGKTATFTVTLAPESFTFNTSSNGLRATFDYRTKTTDEQDDMPVELQVQYVKPFLGNPAKVQVEVYPVTDDKYTVKIPSITGYSTKSTLPDEIYIDLDLGEAFYYDSDGNVISLNNVVNIPTQLPTIAPGTTTIGLDNTITEFKIMPRWWKL